MEKNEHKTKKMPSFVSKVMKRLKHTGTVFAIVLDPVGTVHWRFVDIKIFKYLNIYVLYIKFRTIS